MLIMGAACLLLAVVALSFGVFGVPTTRAMSRERFAAYSTAEMRPTISKVKEGVVTSVDSLMVRRGWRPFSTEELEIAGIKSSMGSLVVTIAAVTAAVLVAGTLVSGSLLVGLVLAVIVPFAGRAFVSFKASRRRKRFSNQLAPLLQMLAASLRAGHSLPRALDAAAADAESPMAEELSRVINEYRLGRDLIEALEHVAVRMKSDDFMWIAGAIEAQRETGGNLNEILDQVAQTIRERQHIRLQVMALSAEGRMSAYILMALPLLIGIYYSFVASDLVGVFIGQPIGKLLLVVAAVMYILGGFWMRSIVRIEF